jgi:hypothetical protein
MFSVRVRVREIEDEEHDAKTDDGERQRPRKDCTEHDRLARHAAIVGVAHHREQDGASNGSLALNHRSPRSHAEPDSSADTQSGPNGATVAGTPSAATSEGGGHHFCLLPALFNRRHGDCKTIH